MPVPYSTPNGKFISQKAQAKQRGIAWELTFEQWWAIWQESGHWNERGTGGNRYAMARRGDVGPYSVANVYICTNRENIRDAHTNGTRTRNYKLPTERKGCPVKGWYFDKTKPGKPYSVMCRRKFVGRFATQEEAEAAYRAASSQPKSFPRPSGDQT